MFISLIFLFLWFVESRAIHKYQHCTRKKFYDSFQNLDWSFWNLESGRIDQLKIDNGLKIELDSYTLDHVVLSTRNRWTRAKVSIDLKVDDSPGLVTPIIFRAGEGSDEVDLEVSL